MSPNWIRRYRKNETRVSPPPVLVIFTWTNSSGVPTSPTVLVKFTWTNSSGVPTSPTVLVIFTWTNSSGVPHVPSCSGNIYLDEFLWCSPSVLIKVHHREEGVGGVGQLPLNLLLRESNIVCKMLPVGFLNKKCKNIIFIVLIKRVKNKHLD